MRKRDAEARERWNARGHEMLDYLEQLEPNQRPMPLTAWSDIWECNSNYIHHAFKHYIPEVGRLYTDRREQWWNDLAADVAAFYAPGKRSVDRRALALKYHTPEDLMKSIIDNLLRRRRDDFVRIAEARHGQA
jgi:hypothetical protein